MHTSVVALEAVPDDQVEKYGIAAVKGPGLRIVELVIADNEPFAVLLPDVLMYHPKKAVWPDG